MLRIGHECYCSRLRPMRARRNKIRGNIGHWALKLMVTHSNDCRTNNKKGRVFALLQCGQMDRQAAVDPVPGDLAHKETKLTQVEGGVQPGQAPLPDHEI